MPHARYETHGDVGEIVLSNPPLNLFDATLMAELRTAVDEAASAAPRALIIRAEGKVFTAGVDVHVFEGLDIAAADALTGSLLELAHTLEDMPFPTSPRSTGCASPPGSSSHSRATCCGRPRARASAWWRRWSGSPR